MVAPSDQLRQQLPGAAVEVSHSGRGLHIWGTGAAALPFDGKRNMQHGIELYSAKRFIALGRPDATGDVVTDCTAALGAIVGDYFPVATDGTTHNEIAWTSGPCEAWEGYTDDGELIQAAKPSKSGAAVFGTKASFVDLWEGNGAVLAKFWPHAENGYDRSSADAALAQHLAFWTGNNCERMQALMWQSRLRRYKWEREHYLRRTMLNAVSLKMDVYGQNPDKPQGNGDAVSSDPAAAAGSAVQVSEFDFVGITMPHASLGFIPDKERLEETDIAIRLSQIPECHKVICYDKREGRRVWYSRAAGKLWLHDEMPIRNGVQNIRTLLTQTGDVKRGLRTRSVLYELESRFASEEPWDADPELCGLPNDRVLDLKNGVAWDATEHDPISRRLGAVPESGNPDRWLQFLHETVPAHDEDAVIAWLRRWCGYLLTGYAREEKFLFLSGPGGNGKGTLIKTLQKIMGTYSLVVSERGLVRGLGGSRNVVDAA